MNTIGTFRPDATRPFGSFPTWNEAAEKVWQAETRIAELVLRVRNGVALDRGTNLECVIELVADLGKLPGSNGVLGLLGQAALSFALPAGPGRIIIAALLDQAVCELRRSADMWEDYLA